MDFWDFSAQFGLVSEAQTSLSQSLFRGKQLTYKKNRREGFHKEPRNQRFRPYTKLKLKLKSKIIIVQDGCRRTLVKPPKDYTLEDAKKFMEKAKGRVGENKFQSFRDHLEEFLDNNISFQKLLQEMCVIFHGKPDLLEEFVNRFVPRGISMLEDEMKQPAMESKPRPKSRRPSYAAVAFVGGIGFVLGVWAHLLF